MLPMILVDRVVDEELVEVELALVLVDEGVLVDEELDDVEVVLEVEVPWPPGGDLAKNWRT